MTDEKKPPIEQALDHARHWVASESGENPFPYIFAVNDDGGLDMICMAIVGEESKDDRVRLAYTWAAANPKDRTYAAIAYVYQAWAVNIPPGDAALMARVERAKREGISFPDDPVLRPHVREERLVHAEDRHGHMRAYRVPINREGGYKPGLWSPVKPHLTLLNANLRERARLGGLLGYRPGQAN